LGEVPKHGKGSRNYFIFQEAKIPEKRVWRNHLLEPLFGFNPATLSLKVKGQETPRVGNLKGWNSGKTGEKGLYLGVWGPKTNLGKFPLGESFKILKGI